jgi:hypothetical protein
MGTAGDPGTAEDGVLSEQALRQLRATVRETPGLAPAAPVVLVGASGAAAGAGLARAETAAAPPPAGPALAPAADGARDGALLDPAPTGTPAAPAEAGPPPAGSGLAAPVRAGASPQGGAADDVAPAPPVLAAAAVQGSAAVIEPLPEIVIATATPAPAEEAPAEPARIAAETAQSVGPRDEPPSPEVDRAARIAGTGRGAEDGWIAIEASFTTPDADGSERLRDIARIEGVPAAARLSLGREIAPGAWEVATADLLAGRVAILPPPDSDATIRLTLRVVAEDADAAGVDRRELLGEATVAVEARADAPRAVAADAAGEEDRAIALDLSAALSDADGSERLSIAILGLPAGAALSAGTRNADGSWSVSPTELPGLSLLPPRDVSGRLGLTLRVTATEAANGDAATREVPFAVSIAPRAEADAALTAAGSGDEDGWIAIAARFATADADGSERLDDTILVDGVPAGATLNRGVELSPGRWSVPRDALLAGEVALRPPADSDAVIAVTLTATLRDESAGGADSRTLVTRARIEVAAVADAPAVAVRDGAGTEDRAIALDLSAALLDTDGSEALTLRLIGLPAGATLSAGTRDADGGWSLTASDLPGLTLTPPRDFAGEIALLLRATATEASNSDAATVERGFSLHVSPVVDGASLSATAAGREDRAIPIGVVFGASADASETWDPTALIRGVPVGARLSAGEDLGGGLWRVDRAALAAGDIAITPPADSDAPIALTIEAVLRDGDGGGATRSVTAGVTVGVAAIADAPLARAGDVAGEEDGAIALDLSAALSDTDGSEGLALAILGLPAGATLSAGTRNADGSWSVTAAQLDGLAVTPPRDFAGALSLVLRATATEASNGDAATTERPFAVTVAPRAERATIAAGGEGSEDGWVPIRGTVATTDRDGSESLGAMLTVGDVPAGAVLNHGTETAPGVWSVPLDVFLAGHLAIRPPAQSDADITLRLGVTVQDGDDSSGTDAPVTLVVRAVADAPSVQVADAHGREDTPIRLAGLGGALADTDGSERLSFVLAGLPAGATLTAGTRGADGSWTLTPAQLATVSVTPPAQFSGSMTLSLTAVATEARDGAPAARSTANFTVAVDPVADAGSIAGSVTGNEDGWIALRPTFATPDADGSETWSATTLIGAVPVGATLSRGTELAPGEWQVATADLRAGRVSIRPPADSDADFKLTMRATLSDAGNGTVATREVSGSHAITVRAVADAPAAAAADVAGSEDRAIALDLSAALADRDGSETLSLALLGLPAGAALSAGTRNADGSWSLAAADLPGLSLTPPRDFSGEIGLTLRATAREQRDGGSATTDRAFSVRVEAVADAPTLRTGPAIGAEDGAIALRVSAATTDADGSERIAGFRILDLPDGAVLRAGGATLAREADGSVIVDAAAAATLSVTPPADSDADFTLRVAAISTEPNGSRAESAPRDLPVRVDAVADAPVWLRIGASGAEDAPIALDLAARLVDADGSERFSYVISGVPEGAVLSAGAWRGPGSWSLTAKEAAGVTLTPPADFSGTITLTATAVAQEANGGAQAISTVSFPVRVAAVIDTTDWSSTARGNEDTPIALNLAPPLRDADGSERLVGEAVVEGVPSGAVLRLADGSAVAAVGGVARIAVERLAGATLTMPRDSDVAARLGVRVTVQDGDGSRAELRGTVTVDPAGVADRPALGVGEVRVDGHASDDPAKGWSSLPVKAALADADGSESLTVWIRDLPAGFVRSAGTPAGDGVWLLRDSVLPGLRFRPPAGFDDKVELRVEAVAVEREGDQATRTATLLLRVDSVKNDDKADDDKADGGKDVDKPSGKGLAAPELAVGTAEGVEDAALPFPIKLGAAAEGTTQVVLVGDLPVGALLSAGIRDPERDVWVLQPKELDGLRLIPPADFAGALKPTVTAIAIDGTGATARTGEAGSLTFEAVADNPSIGAAPAAAAEDRAIALNLGIAVGDADGSESVIGITLSGLTAGARIAAASGIRDNGDGSWTVEPSAVGAVRLIPPADAHGTIGLTVTATVREASNGATATASHGVSVAVAPVPDAPTIAVADAAGREDQPIALGLSAALADRDGSEALSLVVAGLPAGARLSAGINNGDGSWTLSPAQLAGLTVTPPGDWSGSMALTLHAHAMERSTGQVATSSLSFRVAVAGVADAPLLDAAAQAGGREDSPIALDIVTRLTDTDGSEALTLVVTGVPAGAVFSAGQANPDGSWTIPGASLPGLAFTPPPNFAGTLRLDMTVTATEADGDIAATRFQLAVTVDPVADAPVLAVTGATGAEDSVIRLPIAATLVDADGSEHIARFLVAGVPAGATLSAGTRGADGVWTLTPDQAATVTLTPPAHFSGSLSLTVSAVSREAANGAEAVVSATLPVTVTPVADAPRVTVKDVAGTEDRAVALNLAVALMDTDGSESIAAISLAGLPAGFALSAGTPLGDGTWRLAGGDLAGLKLHAPAEWNGTLALTLAATARDGASEATTTRSLGVTIAAENDAPILTLAAAPAAAAGQDRASIVAETAIADLDSPRMGSATITLTGAGAGERLVFDGYAIREEDGRSLVGETGIALLRDPRGTVTLSGAASASVYERVLGSLAIEDPGGLGAGRRDIAVTLRDEGGATAATRAVSLAVEPSVVTGGAADGVLAGTAGHDSFHGGTGNETMTGGAGADLFVVTADGGRDSILGGDGSWLDTVRVDGAGAPGEGGWTLVIDPAVAVTQGERSFDFAQPMAASIHFADGTQVELAQIERITW